MARTLKEDWFNNLLADFGHLVSGHSSFHKYLGIEEECFCTLRFLHKDKTLLFFLVLEIENVSTFSYRPSEIENVNNIYNVFGTALHILAFDPNEQFLLYDKNTKGWYRHDSVSLSSFFEGIDDTLTKNRGTYKEINKTTNDGFQIWTRKFLTRNCVVNDIDALYINGQLKILYELKRVVSVLKDWRPYLDDYSNYNSFICIGKDFKLNKRLVAYNESNEKEVALHFNLSLAPDKSYIGGSFFLMSPKDAIKPYVGENYKSTHVRQRY